MKFRKITSLLLAIFFLFMFSGTGVAFDQHKRNGKSTHTIFSKYKKHEKSADTVLLNGYVYTVDSEKPVAEIVAIKGKKIIYVGNNNKKLRKLIGKNTDVIDLEGKMVVPAFVDAHMHPGMSGATYLFNIVLYDAYSHEEYIANISQFIEEHGDLTEYKGMGFLRSVYDIVGPRKEALDEIESIKPISITSADGHSAWVNSAALEMAGIDKFTSDPTNGVIKRVPGTEDLSANPIIYGEPAGLLQEAAAGLVAGLFPEPTKEQYKEGLLFLQGWFNSVGITTCHDAWVPIDSPDYYEAYNELAEDGLLTVRYRGSWYLNPQMDVNAVIDEGILISEKFKTPHFQIHSFKFFADEVIEEETGLLLEEYSHRPGEGWFGIKDWEDDALFNAYQKIDAARFQIHTHQIGDGAARYALDALEAVQDANGKRDSRHSFAHMQMMTPSDVLRMADLGMNAITAPYWMVIDDYFWDLYLPYLGPQRAYYQQYPMQSLFDAGINVAVHSDFSVSNPDPMAAIYMGMMRNIPERIFYEWYGFDDSPYVRDMNTDSPVSQWHQIGVLPPFSERATLEEMIQANTFGGAYANFLDKKLGSIKKGKIADLVVLDQNLFEIDVEKIPNVQVVMTFFEGKKVFEQ